MPLAQQSGERHQTPAVVCLLLAAVLLLAAAWTLPFSFESQSILYKFGAQRIALRCGKLVGLTVALLLFYQLAAVSPLGIPDRLFSRGRRLAFHRRNGLVLGLLILLHPVLILGADDFAGYPLEKKYWPEFVGAAVLLLLLALVATAVFRERLRLPYPVWLRGHRLAAPLVAALLFVHLLSVSETFRSGPPRLAAFCLAGGELLLFAGIWLRGRSPGRG